MKLIIAGSRTLNPTSKFILDYIYNNFVDDNIEEVVCGLAQGVDLAGKRYAIQNNIPVKEFPAEWDKYQNRAGPIRNNKMAVYADALLLIWDGQSKGSRHMKQAMLDLDKPVFEIILR